MAFLANGGARLYRESLIAAMAAPTGARRSDYMNAPRRAAMDTLSMGMSEDCALAVAEGATMVRVGTALFGARPVKA